MTPEGSPVPPPTSEVDDNFNFDVEFDMAHQEGPVDVDLSAGADTNQEGFVFPSGKEPTKIEDFVNLESGNKYNIDYESLRSHIDNTDVPPMIKKTLSHTVGNLETKMNMRKQDEAISGKEKELLDRQELKNNLKKWAKYGRWAAPLIIGGISGGGMFNMNFLIGSAISGLGLGYEKFVSEGTLNLDIEALKIAKQKKEAAMKAGDAELKGEINDLTGFVDTYANVFSTITGRTPDEIKKDENFVKNLNIASSLLPKF